VRVECAAGEREGRGRGMRVMICVSQKHTTEAVAHTHTHGVPAVLSRPAGSIAESLLFDIAGRSAAVRTGIAATVGRLRIPSRARAGDE
jgi:hypothetical protein